MSAIAGALARVFGRAGAARAAAARSRVASLVTRNAARRSTFVRPGIPRPLNKNVIRVRLNTGQIPKPYEQFPRNWPLGYKMTPQVSGLDKIKFQRQGDRLRGLMSDADYAFKLSENQGSNRFYNKPKYFNVDPKGGMMRPNDVPWERPIKPKRNFYTKLRTMLDTFHSTPGVERGPAGRRIREFLDRGPLKNMDFSTNIRNVPANVGNYMRSLYRRLRMWYRNFRRRNVQNVPLKNRYRGFYPGERTGPLNEPIPDRPLRFQTREQIRAANRPKPIPPGPNYFNDIFKETSFTDVPLRPTSVINPVEASQRVEGDSVSKSRIPRSVNSQVRTKALAPKPPVAVNTPSRIPRPVENRSSPVTPSKAKTDISPKTKESEAVPKKSVGRTIRNAVRRGNQNMKVTISKVKPKPKPRHMGDTISSAQKKKSRNVLQKSLMVPGLYSKKNE